MDRAVAVPGEEELDRAVVERQDPLVLSLDPPQRDQLGQLLGHGLGEVVALGAVDVVVVELPGVLVERHALGVAGDRLPSVGDDRPVAEHLVVLHQLGCGSSRIVERVPHRLSADRHLLVAAVDVRGGDPEEVVDRGDDVVDVVELVADGSSVGDLGRPVDDEGHVDPALMGVLLVPLERGVAGLGPAPRVVGMAVGATDVVEPLDRFVRRLDDHVEVLHLVHDAERTTLLAGPVVGQQKNQRVVELTELLEVVDEPADLGIGVLEERGERLLQACGQATLVLGEGVPRLDAGVAGSQFGVGGEQPHLDLPSKPLFASDVPPVVEGSTVLLHVLVGRLMGGVLGPEGEVGEERAVGADRYRIVDELDGVVDQVFAQVVALFGRLRGLDAVVVVDQLGRELVRLTFEEAVEPVESALARPLVVGTGSRGVLHGAKVPLADGEGGIPLVSEHLGHGGGVVGDVAAHVRVAAVEVGDRSHTHRVVVATCQQRRPGG